MNIPKNFPILLSLFLTCCVSCASAQSRTGQEVRKLERAQLQPSGNRAPEAEKLRREFAGKSVRSFKSRGGNMSTLAKPENLS